MKLTLIGLVGVAVIGLVSPAEAPIAHADTPESNSTVIVPEAPLKAYKRYAWELVGYDRDQFVCLELLWAAESGWRPRAQARVPVYQMRDGKRTKLYAGGIPQIVGLDPDTHWVEQIERGIDYITHRYGTPCQAWTHWRKQEGIRGYGWY